MGCAFGLVHPTEGLRLAIEGKVLRLPIQGVVEFLAAEPLAAAIPDHNPDVAAVLMARIDRLMRARLSSGKERKGLVTRPGGHSPAGLWRAFMRGPRRSATATSPRHPHLSLLVPREGRQHVQAGGNRESADRGGTAGEGFRRSFRKEFKTIAAWIPPSGLLVARGPIVISLLGGVLLRAAINDASSTLRRRAS
jgi:hypothetical protein